MAEYRNNHLVRMRRVGGKIINLRPSVKNDTTRKIKLQKLLNKFYGYKLK